MFEYKEELTREFVLSRITEEDIFLKYLNIYPTTEGYFRNPLREDAHPDCKFYRDTRGVLKFKDFAYRLNIDCFNLVEMVSPDVKGFHEILKRIAKDFDLYGSSVNYQVVNNWEELTKSAKKTFSDIRVKRRDFSKADLRWFQEQGISHSTLIKYKYFALQYLWLNGSLIYEYRPSDLGYVQQFGDGYNYKAYFPLRKSYRFLQNVGDILQGYEQLPKSGGALVMTQSNKAVMAISEFEISTVAPLSETVLPSEEIMKELFWRFPIIFTLFDRDRAGMAFSQLMRKKYNTIPLLFDAKGLLIDRKTEAKDWNDHYKRYGLQYMLDAIEEIKQQYL